MPSFETGSNAPKLPKPEEISLKAEECKRATLWSEHNFKGTPQEILPGQTLFSPKKTIGSVDMEGNCSMLLFQISGSCTENSDKPAVPVPGDTLNVKLLSSGVTEFSCAALIDSSFKAPATAP